MARHKNFVQNGTNPETQRIPLYDVKKLGHLNSVLVKLFRLCYTKTPASKHYPFLAPKKNKKNTLPILPDSPLGVSETCELWSLDFASHNLPVYRFAMAGTLQTLLLTLPSTGTVPLQRRNTYFPTTQFVFSGDQSVNAKRKSLFPWKLRSIPIKPIKASEQSNQVTSPPILLKINDRLVRYVLKFWIVCPEL